MRPPGIVRSEISGGGNEKKADPSRPQTFNLSPQESTNFSLSHKHSGLHGDGQKIPAAFINWASALVDGAGPILVSPNGTQYRLGVDNAGALTTTPI